MSRLFHHFSDSKIFPCHWISNEVDRIFCLFCQIVFGGPCGILFTFKHDFVNTTWSKVISDVHLRFLHPLDFKQDWNWCNIILLIFKRFSNCIFDTVQGLETNKKDETSTEFSWNVYFFSINRVKQVGEKARESLIYKKFVQILVVLF